MRFRQHILYHREHEYLGWATANRTSKQHLLLFLSLARCDFIGFVGCFPTMNPISDGFFASKRSKMPYLALCLLIPAHDKIFITSNSKQNNKFHQHCLPMTQFCGYRSLFIVARTRTTECCHIDSIFSVRNPF